MRTAVTCKIKDEIGTAAALVPAGDHGFGEAVRCSGLA